MDTNKIRQSFLDLFHSKNHEIIASSSLVPNNDETLLLQMQVWCNSRMFS